MEVQTVPRSGRGSIPTSSLHLIVRPISLREANDFVQYFHRHSGRTAKDGGKFAICAEYAEAMVGVAIVGNPLSATYMNRSRYGLVAEVLRVCLSDQAPRNTNSFLYAACARICREMGYDTLITYTLCTESSSSLRGAGWKYGDEVRARGGDWGKDDHLSNRRIYNPAASTDKVRWEMPLRQHKRRW